VLNLVGKIWPWRIVSIIVTISAGFAVGQAPENPVRAVPDPGIVTTLQTITPAGVQSVFNGRIYGISFGASSSKIDVALKSGYFYEIDWERNNILKSFRGKTSPGMQGITWDPVAGAPLLSGSAANSSRLVRVTGTDETVLADHLGTFTVGEIAVAADKNTAGERDAAIALTYEDSLAVVDLESGKLKAKVRTGIAPFGVVVDRNSSVAYVSNWGGRFPRPGELTSPTGNMPKDDKVVIDQRGIASTGTIVRVDLLAGKVSGEISVGLHPTAMQWDENHHRLYVANSNSDTVSVVDTETDHVVKTLVIQPFARKVAGIAPNALAIDADGRTLYVACGGINAIAVIRTADGQLQGLIPTGWYPNDLRTSPDGKYLAVANLMGVGPGGDAANVERWAKETNLRVQPGPTRRFVHSDRSSLQVIRIPESAQLAGYTTAVIENNKMLGGESQRAARPTTGAGLKPLPVPLHAGDPSLIDHVVFIIKENRTYDQVFGDLPQANGDPSLLVYGPDITPNQHRLAEQFVVLDNFYATGGNSADGHQWVTQASETDYCYWPGYSGRTYPFDGSDPIAPASSGFIWDLALKQKKTVEDFGEYVSVPIERQAWAPARAALMSEWKNGSADFSGRFQVEAPIPPLNSVLAKDFPFWTLAVPDVVRAQIFQKHLDGWAKKGSMPNLVLVQLPGDHTAGTDPGMPVPEAMIADNDLAVGQIVEGLSHSPFWKNMAIFVVEDDAQAGLDHVDGHRTVALAISPYTYRGTVDSTVYSQTSMLKTIELMLGLPTMSLFDLIANDMRNTFHDDANLASYQAVIPKQPLDQLNPTVASLKGPAHDAAVASLKMNFQLPDAAPTEKLNHILWGEAHGWRVPYPSIKQSAVFVPYSLDLDDDEKESLSGKK
jgi:YVTN family beta-propeller protein